MGVYNSVYIPCPKCGKASEEQFKPGSMNSWSFLDEQVPLDYLDYLKDCTYECYYCETKFITKVDIEIKISNKKIELIKDTE